MELSHLDLHQARLKVPFNIPIGLKRIERAIEAYPKAMLFELAEMNYNSPFQQLVACVVSARTLDEVSRESAIQLLNRAPTPQDLLGLSESEIAELIAPANHFAQKAKTLRSLAQELIERFSGEVPCELDVLLSLKGVSPQTANLVLAIACGTPRIGVNKHVHRIANRWGCISTWSPAHTRVALEKIIPKHQWINLNKILVPFGKHVCTPLNPKCNECPISEMCAQVGVAITHLSYGNQSRESFR